MHSPTIHWGDWNPAAFAGAQTSGRPVLLFLTTHWSRDAAAMEITVFEEPAVAELIVERAVPVRVDADGRPDVNARYNMGRIPTVALLAPDGALIAGGAGVTADGLREALHRASDAPRAARARRPEPECESGSDDGGTADVIAALSASALDAFDPEYGGFGELPKVAWCEALAFGLTPGGQPDSRLRQAALHTLEAVATGPMRDADRGGFFRAALTRGWEPAREKTLETNVRLGAAFLTAWQLTRDERFRDAAVGVVDYARRVLEDPNHGGFFASEGPDHGGVDTTIYASVNARAAEFLTDAAEAFGEAPLLECAGAALDRVLQETYRPGEGIAHVVTPHGGGGRGQLADHVCMAAASLAIHRVSDKPVYLDLAVELMEFATRLLGDTAAPGFFDTAEAGPAGVLWPQLKPFIANCEAARVMSRLGIATEDSGWATRADELFEALRRVAPAHGLDGCAYGWALHRM